MHNFIRKPHDSFIAFLERAFVGKFKFNRHIKITVIDHADLRSNRLGANSI